MKHLNRLVTTGVSTCLLIALACASDPALAPAPVPEPSYWPTEAWRHSTPEQQGVDSEILAQGLAFAADEKANIHSVLVIRHGYVVLDAYLYPFSPNTRHDLASATKSFTSTLIGIAIDKGYIEGVDQGVLPIFSDREVAAVDARKKALTVEDLLTMRPGLDCHPEQGEITLFQMMQSPDWVQFVLDLPMARDPGTHFVYCSPASHLLAATIRKTADLSALEFAREHLFGPLGIGDVTWPMDPRGVDNTGWGSLRVRPHDMAKLGYLYLHGGVWDGERLLPSSYVAAATSRKTAVDRSGPIDGYGYQWWTSTSRAFFAARGRGGQRIYVVPGQDLIVVLTGAGGRGPAERMRYDLLLSYLVPAARSDRALPANPEGVAKLQAAVRQVATPPAEGARSTIAASPLAQRISGRRYEMEPNPFGFASLALVFDRKVEGLLRMSLLTFDTHAREIEYRIGLDGMPRVAPGRFGLPAVAEGYWRGEDVFAIDLDEVGNINRWRFTLTFQGDRVAVEVAEGTGLPSATFEGEAKD